MRNLVLVSFVLFIFGLFTFNGNKTSMLAQNTTPYPIETPIPTSLPPFPEEIEIYSPLIIKNCLNNKDKQNITFPWWGWREMVPPSVYCGSYYYRFITFSPDANDLPDVEYLPYIWCKVGYALHWETGEPSDRDDLARFKEHYDAATYDGFVLFVNEPDSAGSCEMEPLDVAIYLHEVNQECPNCKIVGPNTTHWGYNFFVEFFNSYINIYGELPPLYAIGTHYYSFSSIDKIQHMESYVSFVRDNNLPYKIWLTEWGEHTVEGLEDSLCYYESIPELEEHFWFAPVVPDCSGNWENSYACSDFWNMYSLVDYNSNLTDLGKTFIHFDIGACDDT